MKRICCAFILLLVVLIGVLLYQHYSLGESLAHYDNAAESLEKVNRMIDNNPENYEPYYLKGLVLYDIGEFQEAIFNFDKALKLNSNPIAESMIMTGIADSLAQLGRYDEAITSYDIALHINSNNLMASENRAILLSYMDTT